MHKTLHAPLAWQYPSSDKISSSDRASSILLAKFHGVDTLRGLLDCFGYQTDRCMWIEGMLRGHGHWCPGLDLPFANADW